MADNPDELVVDLLHLEVVEEMLRPLGIGYNPIADSDRDERLGLVRLAGLTDGSVPLDVGEVLALLQQRCARERDGWTPTMGRNRDVYGVIGESHKPMDGGPPEPADVADLPTPADPHVGQGVRIGIVDTRPAAAGVVPIPYRAGHAGFVRSLIAAEAPGAHIVEHPVLNPQDGKASSWDTARAIVALAAEHELDILNLSLGCFTASGGPPLVIARAIERLGPHVLVVAAAGNHGELEVLTRGHDRHSAAWPAAIPPVVAIGAVDRTGAVPAWSPSLPWIRYAAPGVDVVGAYFDTAVDINGDTTPFTGAAKWSGTSFAAATATGAIAARTVPGSMSPRAALAAMVADGHGPVRPI
ncbi:S8/S53 family peptidase [Dactylosporangium matsuzakiense]|uniref:Peptidase S8/S53 domain-containing protein n=1 Tax=Dactylosporangium matsuzakiense TaxID=53360 RepID=A0A9W6KNG7_9ACTN|nr:S8/S53 family peptidase [Dactylosporangium matsuzakiense]UWZ45510.1 S8/S53 family peptidase [Dactylosporangium matsuzakiense]GLL04327.1 hypothetical protein GCM10017581_060740 [Dactylosporangium matsuzakiense]